MKKFIFCLVLILIPAISNGENNSNFTRLIFKEGVAIDIPTNWSILNDNLMKQLDTNTEALTGIRQGNNNILVAANCYTTSKNASATVRLSVRHKPTIDQNQLLAMTDEDIELEALLGKSSLENTLKKIDASTLVTDYKKTRKNLNSFACFETVYTLNNKERMLLFIVPLGDRRIKLHLSYKLSEENYLKPTIMHIIDSLSIRKATVDDTDAEEKFSRYEKQDYWFSIMYPATWKLEEKKLGYKFTAKFLGKRGNIVVAVKNPMDFHKKTIGLIKEANLSAKQLEDLSHMMYDKVPGVVNANIFITTLSNERALGSVYYYKIETLGSTIGYMRVLKIETLHKGKFYKLETSSQMHDSPQAAEKKFNQIWPTFETAIKSFAFLPY